MGGNAGGRAAGVASGQASSVGGRATGVATGPASSVGGQPPLDAGAVSNQASSVGGQSAGLASGPALSVGGQAPVYAGSVSNQASSVGGGAPLYEGAAPAANPRVALRLGSGLTNIMGRLRANLPAVGGDAGGSASAGIAGGSVAGGGQGAPVSTGSFSSLATSVASMVGGLALGGSQASGTGMAVNQPAVSQANGPVVAPHQAAAHQPPATQAAVTHPEFPDIVPGTGQVAVQMVRVLPYGAMDNPPPPPAGYHYGRLFSLPRGSPSSMAVVPGFRLVQLVHIDPVQDWQRPHIFYRLTPQRQAPLMADARLGRQNLTIAIPDSWPIMTAVLN